MSAIVGRIVRSIVGTTVKSLFGSVFGVSDGDCRAEDSVEAVDSVVVKSLIIVLTFNALVLAA